MPSDVPQRDDLNAPPTRLDDLFEMRKGERVATCACWTHAFGWKCRLFAGEEMISTHVCRSDAEVEAFGKLWRDALTAKGWQ